MSKDANKNISEKLVSVENLVKFQYRVRKRQNPGLLVTSTDESESKEALIKKLHAEGYLIISLASIPKGGEETPRFFQGFKFLLDSRKDDPRPTTRLRGIAKQKEVLGLFLFSPVKTRELITFATQLSALLEGGLPILKALEIVKRGTRNKSLMRVLNSCIYTVQSGFALSYAINEFPKIFPPVWLNLIGVGEASGTLGKSLTEVAHYQDASERIKNKVATAFMYPTILIILAIGVLIFFMLFVIPKFEAMFQGLSAGLPLITKMVLGSSQLLRDFFPLIFLCILGFCAGITFASRSKEGRLIMDLIRLKIPVMGNLQLEVSLLRFARGFATMIRAGVPILDGLTISARLAENAVLERAVLIAREGVQKGRSLGAELSSESLFPPFLTQLVSAGEECGQMDHFLELTANYYEERVNTLLSRLTTLLEPLILVVVGNIIGVVVIATILPIIELSTNMGLG